MKGLGFEFARSISEVSKRGAPTPAVGWGRFALLSIVGAGFLLLLVGRLAQLQIVSGGENRARAEENRLELIRVSAPRGMIFDRNGEPLVRNVPVYRLQITNGEWQRVDKEEADKLRAKGETVVEDVGRDYIYAKALAHVVGYLGEVSEEELGNARESCVTRGVGCDYQLGDLTGKLGIERIYEEKLHGVPGGAVMERGARGKVIRQVSVREPQAGREVYTTLDLGLQQKVVNTLGERKGAVIVSKPKTGEILALASGPGFDPNIFTKGTGSMEGTEGTGGSAVERILNNPDKPLFNRALAGLYPPGSVFKIVTATAGLEEGKIDESTTIEDVGELRVGEFRYGNWYFDQYGRTEGSLDIIRGIKRSNDIFFYTVGELVGPEKLAAWAEKFGLGKLISLGLGGEAEGVVPSPSWKERVLGERWFLGNTYHVAIGQGDLQVTPLQIHQMASVIAAGGKLCTPTIVGGIENGKLKIENCHDIGISQKTIDLVKRGMVEACKPGGTAFPLFNFSTRSTGSSGSLQASSGQAETASASGEIADEDRVACKTGTAQFNDPQERTHAWFVVFGPSQDPQIEVTVMLEGAGEGSYEAAPVAKEILEYWFHQRS